MKFPRRPLKTKAVAVAAAYEVREGTHFPKTVAYVGTEAEAQALCAGREHSRFYFVAAWAYPEDMEEVRAQALAHNKPDNAELWRA